MASVNIQNFGRQSNGAANINVPDTAITATVYDADTNALLADYTGPNAIHFPGVLSTLTADQNSQLLDQIAQTIVLMKAGVQ